MSFFLDDADIDDELHLHAQADCPIDSPWGKSTNSSKSRSEYSYFRNSYSNNALSVFESDVTDQTLERHHSTSSAPIVIDGSSFIDNTEDELEFHMELKSLEMLALIKGPEWRAKMQEQKGITSRHTFEYYDPLEDTVGHTDTEDYLIGSTFDFETSEDGSSINLRDTPHGMLVEQSDSFFQRNQEKSRLHENEDSDDEYEGDVFDMDL